MRLGTATIVDWYNNKNLTQYPFLNLSYGDAKSMPSTPSKEKMYWTRAPIQNLKNDLLTFILILYL